MRYFHHIKNFKQETKEFKIRIIKSVALIVILIAILVVRLFNLQIANHNHYTKLAQDNKLESIPIEPNRGLIYDRNGVLLAENLPTFNLNIAPKHTPSIDTTIDELQTIINITPNDIQQFRKTYRQRRHLEHIPLKLKLSKEEVATFYVNQYRFPGVIIEAKMSRHYPLEKTTASVTGYVGRINSQDLENIDRNNYSATNFIGKLGIEKYYEELLHGRTGNKTAEVGANGHILRILKTSPPIPGKTIYLTIDSNLQQVAHDALGEERGSVVAIDPNNGEILALVSHPSYDPNLFTQGIDSTTYQSLINSKDKPIYNRATLGAFPLASTIKPFIALQGLDTGAITAHSTISDPGWFKLPTSDHIYRDWKYNGHGIVDITKAIVASCDTFFYELSLKLGIKNIDEIMTRFGFGSTTNVDIEEENAGVVASPQWKMRNKGMKWYTGDTIISGIGQGYMLATPLQLAHATATLAMRGTRFGPQLLLATKKPDGTIEKQTPAQLTPVKLKNPRNWNIVINAMQKVISSITGTGHRRFGPTPRYTVAGKTGGAQLFHREIVNENPTPEDESKIPKHLRNHNLFIAFAPVKNPKIAVAVITENSNMAPTVTRKVLDYYFDSNRGI